MVRGRSNQNLLPQVLCGDDETNEMNRLSAPNNEWKVAQGCTNFPLPHVMAWHFPKHIPRVYFAERTNSTIAEGHLEGGRCVDSESILSAFHLGILGLRIVK